ncbi:MAG: FAD:protein FMN transferase [Spirochaetia bacterium]|nr:FAD:protein FMN transferase [Spirochaetia bacterium]
MTVAVMIFIIAFSCRKPLKLIEIQGRALGSEFTIKYNPADSTFTEAELSSYLYKFFTDFQNTTSLYQKSSELIALNQANSKDWIKVSDSLGVMIAYALELSKKTDGYYDITAGALSKLWNVEGIEKVQPELPEQKSIAMAKNNSGYQNLEIKHLNDGYYVYKKNPHMVIDLASLAAGYAADKIAEYLESRKIKNYMIDVGGEFKTSGKNILNDWIIGIENPVYNKNSTQTGSLILKKILLKNTSMATSGNYKNFLKNKNKRYSHIIDTHTGKPVEGNLVSVSVIQNECMKADALATAIFAMGEKRGFEFAAINHIPLLMMIETNKGKIDVRNTLEMDRYLKKK